MDATELRDLLDAQRRNVVRSGPWTRLAVLVVAVVILGLVVANAAVVGWFVFAVALAVASVTAVQWAMRRAMQAGPAPSWGPAPERVGPTPRPRRR